MNISFTVDDAGGSLDNFEIYFTANGTGNCSLGNNQSSTCFNYDDATYIQFTNGSDSDTFLGGNQAQGDGFTCGVVGDSTQSNISCEIDEHYNPNVYKHYPLDFTNLSWMNTTTLRISRNNVWRVNLTETLINDNAEFYKLDFRVDPINSPDEPILAYLCNSTYVTGDPSSAPECLLVASKLPGELQDDGTKFRALFQNNLTTALGDIGFALITSDQDGASYYQMKTYNYLGGNGRLVTVSNDNGTSYPNNLPGNYETDLNLNWFFTSPNTGIVFKISSNDTFGYISNSSEVEMIWGTADLNLVPVVNILTPEPESNITGQVDVNWTTSEPNGDSFETNITADNGSTTFSLSLNIPEGTTNYIWNTTNYTKGFYNLTVESCENDTNPILCGNDTHQVKITGINTVVAGESDSVEPLNEINESGNHSWKFRWIIGFDNDGASGTNNTYDFSSLIPDNAESINVTFLDTDTEVLEYNNSQFTDNASLGCNRYQVNYAIPDALNLEGYSETCDNEVDTGNCTVNGTITMNFTDTRLQGFVLRIPDEDMSRWSQRTSIDVRYENLSAQSDNLLTGTVLSGCTLPSTGTSSSTDLGFDGGLTEENTTVNPSIISDSDGVKIESLDIAGTFMFSAFYEWSTTTTGNLPTGGGGGGGGGGIITELVEVGNLTVIPGKLDIPFIKLPFGKGFATHTFETNIKPDGCSLKDSHEELTCRINNVGLVTLTYRPVSNKFSDKVSDTLIITSGNSQTFVPVTFRLFNLDWYYPTNAFGVKGFSLFFQGDDKGESQGIKIFPAIAFILLVTWFFGSFLAKRGRRNS